MKVLLLASSFLLLVCHGMDARPTGMERNEELSIVSQAAPLAQPPVPATVNVANVANTQAHDETESEDSESDTDVETGALCCSTKRTSVPTDEDEDAGNSRTRGVAPRGNRAVVLAEAHRDQGLSGLWRNARGGERCCVGTAIALFVSHWVLWMIPAFTGHPNFQTVWLGCLVVSGEKCETVCHTDHTSYYLQKRTTCIDLCEYPVPEDLDAWMRVRCLVAPFVEIILLVVGGCLLCAWLND